MTGDSVTAVQFGVGPIGARIIEAAVERDIKFVGALDIDPGKVGRPLGTVAGLDREFGVSITNDPTEALAEQPDLVYHSTLSSLEAVRSQLMEVLQAGAHVVSTTEELSYPWWNNPDIAKNLNEEATKEGSTILGTGINPGFAMDFLPAVLTATSRRVDRVQVTRVQDAAQRRRPLQEKVGAGSSVETFENEIATGAGHVGLDESVAMIAGALGWNLTRIDKHLEPVVADDQIESEYFSVGPGEIAGIRQVGTGVIDDEVRIELKLEMYLGAPDPRDVIHIDGDPTLTVRNEEGFHGDVTTPEIVVNTSRQVLAAEPGLKTMIDLPPGTWRKRFGEG